VDGERPSLVIAANHFRTSATVICFSFLEPNSGRTRARSSDSAFVAVVSPTLARLKAIPSSAYGPKGLAPAAGSTHLPVIVSALETFNHRSASILRTKLFEWNGPSGPL